MLGGGTPLSLDLTCTGVPFPRSGLGGWGSPSQVWIGGRVGGTTSQVWTGGTPFQVWMGRWCGVALPRSEQGVGVGNTPSTWIWEGCTPLNPTLPLPCPVPRCWLEFSLNVTDTQFTHSVNLPCRNIQKNGTFKRLCLKFYNEHPSIEIF